MSTPGSTQQNADLIKAMGTLTKALEGMSKSMAAHNNNPNSPGSSRTRGAAPGYRPSSRNPSSADKKAQRDAKKDADKEYERNRRLHRLQEKSAGDLLFGMMDLNKAFKELSKDLGASRKTSQDVLRRQNEYNKTLMQHDKVTSQFQDMFIDSLQKAMKSTAALKNTKLKSTTTGGRVKELLAIQDGMHDVLDTVRSVKSKRKTNSLSAMKNGDIRSIVQSMGTAGLNIDGVKDEKEFFSRLSKHDKMIASKKQAIEDVKRSGANPGRLAKLTADLEEAQSAKSGFLNNTLGKSISSVESFNKSVNSASLQNFALAQGASYAGKAIEKLGGSGFTISSGLAMIGKALIDYAEYMRSLANTQSGGYHWNLAMDALSMGSTTEAALKYFKGLMFQVSQLGFSKIKNIVNDNRETFKQLGLYGDEALKVGGDFTQNLMSIGFHPKDTKRFNKAFQDYGNKINGMAQLTGASVDELVAMDRELASSSENMQMMLRLNAQERGVKMQSILEERNRVALLVGSNQEAQKFIQNMQKMNAQTADKRIENAAKIRQLAAMTGINGVDAAKLSSIMLKREEQLSPEEREFRSSMMMQIGKNANQIKGSGLMANEMLIDRLLDGQSDVIRQGVAAGADANLSSELKGSTDKNSKTAKDVQAAQQINPVVSSLNDLATRFENAIGNPIIKLLTGIAGGVALIAGVLAVKAMGGPSAAMEKISGAAGRGWSAAKTAGGNVLDKMKGAFKGGAAAGVAGEAAAAGGGAIGKEAAEIAGKDAAKTLGKDAAKMGGKTLLKKIPLLGILAGVGFGISRLMDGDYVGAAGEVASGAASTLPGLGTAASLAIDGALMARDISKANDAVTGTPSATDSTTVKAPSFEPAQKAAQQNASTQQINSDTSNIKQAEKKNSLDNLAATITETSETEQSKMDEMIKLLKALLETSNPQNNGLVDALRASKGSGVSFGDLHDKRTLFATK